jgi:PAS domain S-box-containing protein
MIDFTRDILSDAGFMPHGMCYLWRPDVLSLHVASDALITLAYFSIPFTLLYFVRKRRDLKFQWMFVCFAIFIVACGTTHLMEIWVIWHPVYWISGSIKAITALASVPTAILLVRLIPQALRLPSPLALERANEDLLREIAERKRAESEMRRMNETLEARVGERTQQAQAANLELRREIRERQDVEQGLRESEGRMRAVVESALSAVIVIDAQGKIIDWNTRAERIFGWTRGEVLDRELAEIIIPVQHRDAHRRGLSHFLSTGEGPALYRLLEMSAVRRDGTEVPVELSISPLKRGDVITFCGFLTDITERKRHEAQRAQYASIVESSDDAIIAKTPRGLVTSWNRGAERLFGYTAGEMVHQPMRKLFPVGQGDEETDILEKITRGENVDHFETVRVRKDGTRVDVSVTISPIRNEQGEIVGASNIARDISERKQGERKLQMHLERLELLGVITRAIGERQDLPSIFQVVIRTLEDQLPVDFGCLCLYQLPEALTVVGIGIKSYDLAIDIGLTEQSHVTIDANGLSRCVRGELVYEPDLREVSFAFPQRLAAAGLYAMVAAPLMVESKVFGVLILARRAAQSFSSGECEFLGQLSEHVAVAAHQTQLHGALEVAYADLRQTQQAVMRQEKLRVLGQMASGIAHDINNALSPAALYVESLIEHESGEGETRERLMIIQRAIEGVAQTVARMKEFYSQRDPLLVHVSVSLNQAVEQVIDLTRARWNAMPQESGRVIQVKTDLAVDLPAIAGNESEIRDAITNLILNAADAMPEGGLLTIRSRAIGSDSVQLDVTDTGIGMDEATRNRCLELFFTTKGARGTGLGLAMVYGTVERHGGEIQIESEPGTGTNVRLIFPVASASLDPRNAPQVQVRPQGSLRILVIDDDPIILKSLYDMFELDGHVVEIADGGQRGIDAFRAAEARSEPFAVVITDLGMPYVDGRAVAEAVKAIRPQTPVVLLTGWGQRMLAENDTPANVNRVLAKPPKLATLRSVLAELTTVTPP